jgi:hypothetical protein
VGKIVSTLYKPPILWVSVFTHGGRCLRYRLIPGMARGGFLLSPVIRDCVDFGSLAGGDRLPDLGDQQATSVSLSADTGSGSTVCYRSPMRLRLYRLEYPGQDLSRLDGFRELRSLSRAIARAIPLHGEYPPGPFYLPRCGSVLRVAPDSAIQLMIEGHPQRLALGFGILAPGGSALPETNGVGFRLSAVGPQGDLVPLWSRRLDPLNGETGQGRQWAVIDLSRSPSSELVLETLPGSPKQGNRLQCYWSEIELE